MSQEPSAINPLQDSRRAWLASTLLHTHATWFGRFVRQLDHFLDLSRSRRRRIIRKAGMTLAGVALLLALHRSPAMAADIIVQNGVNINNNGVCSLREAIENANDTASGQLHDDCAAGDPSGADIISLPPNHTFTIQNTLGSYYSSNTGLPLITSAIIIEGNNSTIRRAPDGPAFRLFAVDPSGDLTINEATLRNGISSADGGAIYVYYGNLSLNDVTVRNNTAGSRGGGIAVRYGAMNLAGVTVLNNDAQYGGGISKYGGSATLDSCTISGNEATDNGGGIENRQQDALDILNCAISSNMADSGGGLHFLDSSGTIANTTISGNTAVSGGGMYVEGSTPVYVVDSQIAGNDAERGGGLMTRYFVDIRLSGTTLSANSASDGGGAIFAQDEAEIELTESMIGDNTAELGGGIQLYGTELTVHQSTIDGNIAGSFGGGLYITSSDYQYSAAVLIDQSTISNNQAGASGGGIDVYGTYSEITLVVVNSTISGNQGTIGGGLANYDGLISILSTTVTGNTAFTRGGGLSNDAGTMTMRGNLVSGNESRNGREAYGGSYANLVSNGFNVFGYNNNSGLVNVTSGAIADIIPAAGVMVSDLLLPLADNGGPTLTHALPPGSPALDSTSVFFCLLSAVNGVDQRGQPRNVDAAPGGPDCDSGAFELQTTRPAPPPTLFLPFVGQR